jgi:hypothetical protein
MGNLSNLYISQSFQSLIHLGSDSTASATLTSLQDGYGNSIGVSVNTAGDLFLSGSLTASLQQGYVYVGNASGKTSAFATSSLVTNINTGSLVTTASFNAYTQSNNQRVSSLESNSASVNVSISNLNGATSSYVTETESGSFLITASFDNGSRNLTFTKGNNTTFAVNIPDVSGSIISTGSLMVTGSVNVNVLTFTKGDGSTFSLTVSASGSAPDGTISGSAQITALGFVSSSITASSIITASVNNDDITFTKGDGSQFTIQVATGSFALSSSYAETSSISNNLIVIARNGGASTLAAGTVVHITSAIGDNPVFTTASYDTEALSSNTFGLLRYSSPSGADVEVVVNGVVTGVDTDPVLGYTAGDILYLSSSGQFTKVQPQAPNQIVVLGQVLRAQQNNGSIYVNISNGWELDELHNVQINTPLTGDLLQYESSSYGLWKNKSIVGAGITTTSSFNSYTSSNDQRVSSLEAATGSYATTGSNNFNGNQIITGSVTISGSATTDLTIVGQIFVSSSLTGGTTAPKITVSGSQGTSTINRNSITTRNLTYSAALNPFAIFAGNVTTNDEIGFSVDATAGGVVGWPTGSAIYINNTTDTYPAIFGFQNKATYTDGRVTVLTPLSASAGFTASLQNGYAWVGNASGQNTQVATSSFGTAINTGSFATTGSNTFTGQQTITEGNGLGIVGGGGITLSQNLQNSGSQYASVTIFADPATFGPDLYESFQILDNAGNGIIQMAASTYTPQFGGELVGWLGAGGNNTEGNNTAIIFRTGSADMLVYKPTKFNYPVTISGSLTLTGSANIQTLTASLQQGYVWVGDATGKTTTVATSSFGGGGAAFPYTGSAQITGSLGITGSLNSLPITLSVASNTASINMAAGNHFVLTLPSSSTTHIAPSSIIAGQTINLLIKQQVGPGTGSITFAPSILFPSGLDMQATSTGSAIDLVSMISFDTTNLIAANVKNLK